MMIYHFRNNIYAGIFEHGRHVSLQQSEKHVLSLLIADTEFNVNCHLFKDREGAVW